MVYRFLRRVVYLFFKSDDIQFVIQQLDKQRETPAGVKLLQQRLLILNAETDILRNIIGEIFRRGVCEKVEQLLVYHVGVELYVLLKEGEAVAQKRFLARCAHALGLIRKLAHLGGIKLARGVDIYRLRAVQPLHKHARHASTRLMQLLAHAAHDADVVYIALVRRVGNRVFLRGEEDELIRAHRLVERCDGYIALHIEREQHSRENAQPAKCEQRHILNVI